MESEQHEIALRYFPTTVVPFEKNICVHEYLITFISLFSNLREWVLIRKQTSWLESS